MKKITLISVVLAFSLKAISQITGGTQVVSSSEADLHYLLNGTYLWQVGTNNAGNGTGNNNFFIYDDQYRFTVQRGTGNIGIGTRTPRAFLDISDNSDNALKIVLARLLEGDGTGAGTYLGVKSYSTHPAYANSFSIEHSFYGQINSSINFYRGGSYTGGFITFNTNNNSEKMCIAADGNVGIGTTSPSYKLDIDNAGYGAKQLRWRAPGGQYGYTYSDGAGIGIGNGDPYSELVYLQTTNKSINFHTNGIARAIIDVNGNFGIGISNPQNLLDVNGTIHAREVKVDLNGWSDFVFSPAYRLPSLSEVEQYVKANKHLPEIPSAKEVEQNGVSLGEMQNKLLQKVEELTLYMIDLKKENEQLKAEIEKLKNK